MAQEPITPGQVTQIDYRASGTADPLVTFDGFDVLAPSFTDQTQQVSVANATDRPLGYREAHEFVSFEYDKFAALETLMKAGTPIELIYTLPGRVYTYDPVLFVVEPVFGQYDDFEGVQTAAAGTVPAPPDVAWTDHGLVRQGSNPTITAGSTPDGAGRPIFTQYTLNHVLQMVQPDLAELDSYITAKGKVAFEQPGGAFMYYDNVRIHAIPRPNVGPDELFAWQATIRGGSRTLSDIFIPPGTTPDVFYGFRLRGVAAGTQRSDILTIT